MLASFYEELEYGLYYVIDTHGSCLAYATITIHPSSPRYVEPKIEPYYKNFNPFSYPVVTILFSNTPQETKSFVFCMSNYVYAGRYALLPGPIREGHDIPSTTMFTITEDRNKFGNKRIPTALKPWIERHYSEQHRQAQKSSPELTPKSDAPSTD